LVWFVFEDGAKVRTPVEIFPPLPGYLMKDYVRELQIGHYGKNIFEVAYNFLFFHFKRFLIQFF
jgi:hypothetical protein